jgi:hypothetical protein
MYRRPPFAVRRPNSAAVNKTKRSRIKSMKGKTIRKKSKSKLEMNHQIEEIKTRLNTLENAVESIINLIDNEKSKDNEFEESITQQLSNPDNYEYGNLPEPTNESKLLDAVKNGDYTLTKSLIEKGANPNILDEDEEGYSLPIIAHIRTIGNKDPQEYNLIIRYLIGLRQLDPKIKEEYVRFVKIYNKQHAILGGKTKKRKTKSTRRK